MDKPLRILIAASEMAPFYKTGGLADVTGALPKVFSHFGAETIVILPYYKKAILEPFQTTSYLSSLKIPNPVSSPIGQVVQMTGMHSHKIFLIENDAYYNHTGLYGTATGDYADNLERFTFFSSAIIEFIRHTNWNPHIIHCHDWQTGLIPAYINSTYAKDPQINRIGTLFTIHNLSYQGIFSNDLYSLTNLPWEDYLPEKIEYYGDFSLIKAGIVYADKLSTVSKQYSIEIQSPDFGEGLDGAIRMKKNNLYGILNGIDYDTWNPETDTAIAKPYTLQTYHNKFATKTALQQRCGLRVTKDQRTPIIGMVTRLADQKGLDLITSQFDTIMREHVQLVILGTGDEKYHELLHSMSKKYKDKLSVQLSFDEQFARLIYAGADIFLMPSRFEPCGLGQLIAMKYGTIPVVHHVGGLADTVQPYNPLQRTGNGFIFSEYSSRALMDSLKNALDLFQDSHKWLQIMSNAMTADYSWYQSGSKYMQIFKEIAQSKGTLL